MPTVLHPSSLARCVACPGSAQAENAARAGGHAPEDSPEAAEGTSLHAAFAAAVRAGCFEHENPLVESALQSLLLYSDNKVGPYHVEETLRIEGLAEGTPDVWFETDRGAGHARVFDAKFGYLPTEYFEQMRGYAALIGRRRVDAMVCNPRLGISNEYTFDGLAELVWLAKIHDACDAPSAETTAGAHCGYCDAREACPTLLETVADPALPVVISSFQLISREKVRELARKLPLFEDACVALRARLKAEVIADPAFFAGEWEIKPKAGGRTAKAEALHELLVGALKMLTPDEFMGCVKASVADAEEIWVKKRRAAGATKKQAVEEFKAATAGIVSQGSSEALYPVGGKKSEGVW